MSLFSFNISTGISFSGVKILDFFKRFLSFFVTGCFHTFLDTDYTGMLREHFNAR